MSRKPLACRHCGKQFARMAGAGLFCGDDCEAEHEAAITSNKGKLAQAGFEQHPDTPNIWTKDGVSITEEQVKHIGFKEAVRLHGSAVVEHNANQA